MTDTQSTPAAATGAWPQAAGQQALLRERGEALEERQAAVRLLEAEQQEAAAAAHDCQQEAAALRLSLRLEGGEKEEALEQLQVGGVALGPRCRSLVHHRNHHHQIPTSSPTCSPHTHVHISSALLPYIITTCVQEVQAELAGLRLDHGVLAARMRCIEGSEEACRAQDLGQLEQLVGTIEAAVPKLRWAALLSPGEHSKAFCQYSQGHMPCQCLDLSPPSPTATMCHTQRHQEHRDRAAHRGGPQRAGGLRRQPADLRHLLGQPAGYLPQLRPPHLQAS